MNALAALLLFAGICLVSLVAVELRPGAAPSEPAPAPSAVSAPIAAPAVPAVLQTNSTTQVDTLLARPLFSQTRRPPNVASPVGAAPSAAIPLPRMTAILIDGPRRSAIFAAPGASGGKPSVVAEGGRIGSFTVQTIEPQQVIVMGPDGKRTVRTSFDPTLQPPPAMGLAIPQFPGIAVPGGPPLNIPPTMPAAGYGLPQPAGAPR